MPNFCGGCGSCAGDSDPSPCINEKSGKTQVNQWDKGCKEWGKWDGKEFTPEQQAIADKIWEEIYK